MILEERKSKYNGDIKVVRSLGFGTYIQVNNLTQSGGMVEAIWKETLKRIHRSPITVHRSLILGLGGNGGKINKEILAGVKNYGS